MFINSGKALQLDVEHYSQVFMKGVVYSAVKCFGVLIDRAVPTSLTKTIPCLIYNSPSQIFNNTSMNLLVFMGFKIPNKDVFVLDSDMGFW